MKIYSNYQQVLNILPKTWFIFQTYFWLFYEKFMNRIKKIKIKIYSYTKLNIQLLKIISGQSNRMNKIKIPMWQCFKIIFKKNF